MIMMPMLCVKAHIWAMVVRNAKPTSPTKWRKSSSTRGLCHVADTVGNRFLTAGDVEKGPTVSLTNRGVERVLRRSDHAALFLFTLSLLILFLFLLTVLHLARFMILKDSHIQGPNRSRGNTDRDAVVFSTRLIILTINVKVDMYRKIHNLRVFVFQKHLR